MYFSALKRAIQALEEKKFYDIALLYLEQRGYTELSIIDGPGDGGRDVLCSRRDLRIQLSVQKKWEDKINKEASNTLNAGIRHFIYVTNRDIGTEADRFLSQDYKLKGEVDVTIVDLPRVATALARPNVIARAYQAVGMAIPQQVHAEPEEIAISTLLLFSDDARELRDEAISATLKAQLYRTPNISEDVLISSVEAALPGTNVVRGARANLSRLVSDKKVRAENALLRLDDCELKTMAAGEAEFLAARAMDLESLVRATGLSNDEARQLLDIALEILLRDKDLAGDGIHEDCLRGFLADKKLTRKRLEIYEALSSCTTARIRQYGATVHRIFSADTFDIYRALGRRASVKMVLDASVAMPMAFGLAFREAKSRYGVAAAQLSHACAAHGMSIVVPRVYINEMAAHALQAVNKLDIYAALPSDAREALRSSGNAYISHFSHIAKGIGKELTLAQFLDYFGAAPGKSLRSVENRIQTVLDQFGIGVLPTGDYDPDIRAELRRKKLSDSKLLLDHDAAVVTLLKNDDSNGYILATWDKVVAGMVDELARVYVDTPARVIDFLSMASGSEIEARQSVELMTTLLFMDEKAAEPLARKIDQIVSVEKAYQLDAYVRSAREKNDARWALTPDEVAPFIDNREGDEIGNESEPKD